MLVARAGITQLRVSGAGKDDATVEFGPGLTYITGISDTGKSHVLEWLDFGLGSQTLPRDIPERQGYDEVALELEKEGTKYVVRRWLHEADAATLFEGALDEWDREEGTSLKVNISQTERLKTLSGWLLDLSGFDTGWRVVSNQKGVSQNLSFRTVAPLALVDENRVISTRSPILSPQHTEHTANRSAFQIVLTGDAPTAEEIEHVKQAHKSREAAKQRMELLDRFIADLRAEIQKAHANRTDLEADLSRIDDELATLSERISEGGRRLRSLIAERNRALTTANRAARAVTAAEELESRFSLLEQHYQADLQRLAFLREGGHFFDQIEASHCPTCGRPLESEGECHPESADFEQMKRSAEREIKKLEPRIRDLAKAREDARLDARRLESEAQRHRTKAASLDDDIRAAADPSARPVRARIAQITRRRREVEARLLKFRELDRYIHARQDADAIVRRKVERYRPEQDLPALRSLSAVIQRLLERWKFPTDYDVHFDLETDDLVVGGKERRSYGKGARAVTHAAFTIGLMRQCITANTPHCGFAVIDSPLTPFKGMSDDEPDPELTKDLHAAFLYSLATAREDGQTIIIDNIDPPEAIRPHARIHEFLGPAAPTGRKGFFPAG
jgi:peptidoglycan hydrolase CwlO-like protein